MLRRSDSPGFIDLGLLVRESTGEITSVVYDRLLPLHEDRLAFLGWSRDGRLQLHYEFGEDSGYAGSLKTLLMLDAGTSPDGNGLQHGLAIGGTILSVSPLAEEQGTYLVCDLDFERMTYSFSSRRGFEGQPQEKSGSLFDLTGSFDLIRNSVSTLAASVEQPFCDFGPKN